MRKVIAAIVLGFILVSCAGCGAGYDVPEFKTLEPSQTGFLIPLEGKTSDQKGFGSEKFLNDSKVAVKRIQIPHRVVDTGRWSSKWVPTMSLIIVERKPETREWTEKEKTGTTSKNEGITAESKESIGFMVRMNCSAQINEADAALFLYRYNSKPLTDIMDSEIRARIESKFVEECAKRNLDEILVQKADIMNSVRSDVTDYFKSRGITITVIGLKGELTYLNPEIQASIDNKFKTAQTLVSQRNENERIVAKAKADAEAINIQVSSINQTIRLKELEIASKMADAQIEMGKNWRPNIIGGDILKTLSIGADGKVK